MMKHAVWAQAKKRRFLVMAAISFVAILSVATPSAPSVAPLPPAPSVEEVELLEELVEWLTGQPAQGGEFRVFTNPNLLDAVRTSHGSFDLFRTYNGNEDQQKFLHGTPYGEEIFQAAQRHGVDSLLLAAVVQAESNFRPSVVSPVGAVGLAQVMPSTGREMSTGDLTDPVVNLDIGARYLRLLLDKYSGDLGKALAAYNAGPGSVNRYGDVPPYRETQHYVQKVLSIYVDSHQKLWEVTGSEADLLVLQ